MLKKIRLRKLLVQYIELQKYWEKKADYYFNNHSYYLLDYEIKDRNKPLLEEAIKNKNILSIKVDNLKKQKWQS